jgi:hypothetical protein
MMRCDGLTECGDLEILDLQSCEGREGGGGKDQILGADRVEHQRLQSGEPHPRGRKVEGRRPGGIVLHYDGGNMWWWVWVLSCAKGDLRCEGKGTARNG